MPPEVNIDVRLRQANTQKDLEQLLKFQRETRKESKIGSDEFKRAAAIEVQIKNQIHGLNVQAYGDQGKIKEAYFNSGSALRQFYMQQRVGDRTMRETAQTVKMFAGAFGVGGLGGTLDKAFGSFQQVEFAIKGFSVAAESAGGMMGKLGGFITGIAMPLTILGAGLGFAINQMKELEAATEGTRKKLAATMELGIGGYLQEHPEEAKKYYEGKLIRAESSAKAYMSKYMALQKKAGITGPEAIMASYLAEMAYEKYLEATETAEGLRMKLRPYMEKIGAAPLPEDVDLQAEAPAVSSLAGRNLRLGTLAPAGLPARAGAPGLRKGRISVGVEGPDATRGGGEIEKMGRGVMMVGEMLANSLTQGFQIGFRAGESFLQTFTQSILASMAAIAAQQVASTAVGGLLSLIPGIGTFSGIAGALGSLFGGSSQSVTPSGGMSGVSVTSGAGSMVGEMRKITNAVNSLDLRVDNVGLYMAATRGGIAFERR